MTLTDLMYMKETRYKRLTQVHLLTQCSDRGKTNIIVLEVRVLVSYGRQYGPKKGRKSSGVLKMF